MSRCGALRNFPLAGACGAHGAGGEKLDGGTRVRMKTETQRSTHSVFIVS